MCGIKRPPARTRDREREIGSHLIEILVRLKLLCTLPIEELRKKSLVTTQNKINPLIIKNQFWHRAGATPIKSHHMLYSYLIWRSYSPSSPSVLLHMVKVFNKNIIPYKLARSKGTLGLMDNSGNEPHKFYNAPNR